MIGLLPKFPYVNLRLGHPARPGDPPDAGWEGESAIRMAG
jgi:hypothetical protein